jgi:uncharacterized protein DUF5658
MNFLLLESRVYLLRVLGMLLAMMALTLPARAQDVLGSTRPDLTAGRQVLLAAPPILTALTPTLPSDPDPDPVPAAFRSSPSFLALQISFGALQAMDVYSTVRSLRTGSAEANPVVRGIAGDPLALAAVKAVAATSSLLLIRRVAKKHRATAIVTLVAMNAAYAVIVAHNLRSAR